MSWQEKYKKVRNEMLKGSVGQTEIHENLKTKQECYMKTIEFDDINSDKYIQAKQTFDKLIAIKHPNIIEIYDVYYENKVICFFMEKCEKNLYFLLQEKNQLLKDEAYKNEFIMNLLKQIINGYCRLMEDNIIHRGLKPQNILCNINNDEINFKISDFGVSKIINMNKIYDMTSIVESTQYSAPELQEDEYSNNCDVYSFGIILSQLILGNNQITEQQKMQLPNLLDNNTKSSSQEIVTLLQKMLKIDPIDRISWTELRLRYFYPDFNLTEKIDLQYIKDIKGNDVCVKQICKVFNNACHNELNEIIINKKIKDNQEQNENIVKVIEVLNEKDYRFAYIIMERCDGDLAKLRRDLGLYDYQKIFHLIQEVNNGYQFLIKNKIVHRDIKPQNILYLKTNSGYRYKLTDFGYSFNIDKSNYSPRSKTGTSAYQAPEIDGNQKYDHKCDIYSLGIIIIEMAMEIKLNENEEQIKDKLKKDPHILNIISKLPSYEKLEKQTIFMIRDTVKCNPDERISWDKLNNQIKSMKEPQSQLNLTNQQPRNFQFQKNKFDQQNQVTQNMFPNQNNQILTNNSQLKPNFPCNLKTQHKFQGQINQITNLTHQISQDKQTIQQPSSNQIQNTFQTQINSNCHQQKQQVLQKFHTVISNPTNIVEQPQKQFYTQNANIVPNNNRDNLSCNNNIQQFQKQPFTNPMQQNNIFNQGSIKQQDNHQKQVQSIFKNQIDQRNLNSQNKSQNFILFQNNQNQSAIIDKQQQKDSQ